MTPIVTVSDENYLPGLTALHNSFLRNSADGFEFWAIIRGSDDFIAHVESLGINTIVEPHFPIDRYPTSKRYPEELPLFYWRLLVPGLFLESDYSFFIDCDSLILQSLKPLLDGGTHGHPIAATRSNSSLGQEYGIRGSDECKTSRFGPMSSLYLFNREQWMQKRVFERCIEAMKSDMVFHTVAQGLLQYVIGSNWYEWPWQVQAHAGHDTMQKYPKEQIYTLHFMGTNPWCEFSNPAFVTEGKLKARELWNTYA